MTGPTTYGRTNRLVVRMLSSPAHRVLSRRICALDYRGRRSGQRFRIPTQYVMADPATALILVGRPETKSWWRNFTPPGHPVTISIRGAHRPGVATARLGTDEPEQVAEFLDCYLQRFPRAAKLLPADPAARIARTCIVQVALEPEGSTL
ncbi:MAG: hypothetical protein KDD84_23190 [Caldilineaceae bacterium]|nr:hypothetical protein [Caldilineaceae bacterium]